MLKQPESDDAKELAFTTARLCALLGIPASTLNSWTYGTDPLLTPELVPSAGKRSDRFWSVQDFVVIRTIKVLREAGCPMQQIRKARQRIAEAWHGDLANTVLYWDGHDIQATDQWGDIISLIQHPGQHMIHLVTMPLQQWRAYAELEAKPMDLSDVRARRAAHEAGTRTREVARRLAT